METAAEAAAVIMAMPELLVICTLLEMVLSTVNLNVLMLQLQHHGLEMDIVMMERGVCT